MKRRDQLQRLGRKSKVKILIIGAGINGIGTFRDLALQGIDILMVDQGDFCSGTSGCLLAYGTRWHSLSRER